MPRNTRYRKQFNTYNGLTYRLDIIPGDNTIFDYDTAPIVSLDDETVLSVGNIKLNYRDNLTFGLPEYEPLEVEFNFEYLPSDLKTYLNETYKPGTEATFMIASNFCILWGTRDEITWDIIYVGIQTPQLASEITLSKNNDTISKIKFQPMHTAVLSRSSWLYLNKYFDDASFPEFAGNKFAYSYFDWTDKFDETEVWYDGPSMSWTVTNFFDNKTEAGNIDYDTNFWIYMYRLDKAFEVIRREMQAVFKYLTRQATTIVRTSADATTNYLDWEYNRYIGADGAMKVYKAQNELESLHDRLGDVLPFSSIYVPFIIEKGHVSDSVYQYKKSDYVAETDTSGVIGGLFCSKDVGSFTKQYKTFLEFMSELSEWALTKMLVKYSFGSSKLKLLFEVFGALETTETTINSAINFIENSSSEELTASIGYIVSSVETGNSKGLSELEEVPIESPVLPDLAKSQTFQIKSNVFNWDVNIPSPNPEDNLVPSSGKYEFIVSLDLPTIGQFRGWKFADKKPICCTTLYYGGTSLGIKVTEYVEIGDTTKTASPTTYYSTASFDVNTLVPMFDTSKRYLFLYEFMYQRHFKYGTSTQMNKCFSKILTNNKNWIIDELEVYNIEQIDLGFPQNLLGKKIENGIPPAYDVLLDLPNKGFITSVEYDIVNGVYKLSLFQTGILM